MKLLFDQNLSRKLPRQLRDIYPESQHVPEVGLAEANDSDIWQYAKDKGLAIVSKDADFQQRSLLYGSLRNSSGFGLVTVRRLISSLCFVDPVPLSTRSWWIY